jgi:hypothetical protein
MNGSKIPIGMLIAAFAVNWVLEFAQAGIHLFDWFDFMFELFSLIAICGLLARVSKLSQRVAIVEERERGRHEWDKH